MLLLLNSLPGRDAANNTVREKDRGYYMAAWRYKISLLVLKKYFTSERNIFSTQEEKFRISKWPCNVLFII